MSDGHGNGRWTSRKEEGYKLLFRQSLGISLGALPFPYWHIDLNAGCGFNHQADCEGSPLVFLREAVRFQRPFRAFFCDHEPEFTGALEQVCNGLFVSADGSGPGEFSIEDLPPRSAWGIHCLDNAKMLPVVADAIRKSERNSQHAVGTCLCDPNGYPHGFPTEALIAFAADFPKIDLILNLNVSLFARVRGCKASRRENISKGFQEWPELGELIGLFPRPHWWLRNPPPHKGGERFITFLGRTYRPDRGRFADFYPLTTRIGQEILRTLRHNSDGLLPFMLEEPS